MQRHWQRSQQNRLQSVDNYPIMPPLYDIDAGSPPSSTVDTPPNEYVRQYRSQTDPQYYPQPPQSHGGPPIEWSQRQDATTVEQQPLPRKQLDLYNTTHPVNVTYETVTQHPEMYRCYCCQYVFVREQLHYECLSRHPNDVSTQLRGICTECKSVARDHWREQPPKDIRVLKRVKLEHVEAKRQAGKGSDPIKTVQKNGLSYRQRYPPPPKRKPVKQPPPDEKSQDSFFQDIFANPWNIVKNVAMGLGGGLVYSFVQNLTSKRCISYTLDPNPLHFYYDNTMSKYFHRAASFRDWNEEAYCRALENTDRLFAHELSIHRRKPRVGDKALAKTWVLNIGTDIYNLRYDILDEKVRAKFNILARAILNRVMQHFRNIIRRVNTIYPKTAFLKQKEKRFPQRYERPIERRDEQRPTEQAVGQPSEQRHNTRVNHQVSDSQTPADSHPHSDQEQEEDEPRGSSSDTA